MLFSRRAMQLSAADARFLKDARSALVIESYPFAGFSLLLLIVVLAVGYRWADTAIVDEVTRGEGTVIPSSAVSRRI